MASTHASGELIFNQEFRIMRNGGEHKGQTKLRRGLKGTIWLGNNHRTITRQSCVFDDNSEFTGNNHEFHWKIT